VWVVIHHFTVKTRHTEAPRATPSPDLLRDA
jgi:hypothetical protein